MLDSILLMDSLSRDHCERYCAIIPEWKYRGLQNFRVIRQSQCRLENYGVGIALYIENKMDTLCKQY